MDDYTIYLLGLIGALSSALTAWIANRRFSESHAALEQAYTDLSKRVGELEGEANVRHKEMRALHQELDEGRIVTNTLKTETAELRNGVDKLIEQLIAHGITPVWLPKRFGIAGSLSDKQSPD